MSDDTESHTRRSDPSTSHQAGERVKRSRLEDQTYQMLWQFWPRFITSLELSKAMGIHPWSITPRLAPLLRKGYVECTEIDGINSEGKMRKMLGWRVIRNQEDVKYFQPIPKPEETTWELNLTSTENSKGISLPKLSIVR